MVRQSLLFTVITTAYAIAHPAHAAEARRPVHPMTVAELQIGSPQCQGDERRDVTIDVRRTDAPVKFDLSKTSAELTQMGGEAIHGGTARGLTQDNFDVGYHVKFVVMEVPGGVCVEPVSVQANIGYVFMNEYVVRDYPPGSCQYEAVKQHEDTHVRINMESLDQFFPDYEVQLRAAANSPGFPLFAPNAAVGKAMLMGEFDPVIQRLTAEVNDARNRRHHMLDSPESYARTQAMCSSW